MTGFTVDETVRAFAALFPHMTDEARQRIRSAIDDFIGGVERLVAASELSLVPFGYEPVPGSIWVGPIWWELADDE
jgi:hypothetical protein